MLLAIDPGNDTGFAFYLDDGKFWTAGLGDPRGIPNYRPTRVVIELPQVYLKSKSKGDPNDLIKLAVQVGEYKQYFANASVCTVQLVLPREWKGTLAKDICHTRLRKLLSPEETKTLNACLAPHAKGLQHNVLDAVTLGAWAVGRYRR